jgi:hypothetical protein
MRLIDPAETRSFTQDWSDWLDTETISTSSWAVTPTATTAGATNTTTTATVKLSACSHGQMYQLTNTITTSGGQTAQRSITVRGIQQ